MHPRRGGHRGQRPDAGQAEQVERHSRDERCRGSAGILPSGAAPPARSEAHEVIPSRDGAMAVHRNMYDLAPRPSFGRRADPDHSGPCSHGPPASRLARRPRVDRLDQFRDLADPDLAAARPGAGAPRADPDLSRHGRGLLLRRRRGGGAGRERVPAADQQGAGQPGGDVVPARGSPGGTSSASPWWRPPPRCRRCSPTWPRSGC